MPEPLRVLIVEDSENDARLLERELRRGGFDLLSKRVETEEAMRSALEAQIWDLVISDYSLPSFSAPAALTTLQASGLDLPFIIVSGTVGEEVAVEGMRAGAHDFFLKGSLTRLAPAVQRELDQAAQRRARRHAEEQYRDLVVFAPIGIYRSTREGRFVSVNAALVSLLGYGSPEDVLRLDIGRDVYLDGADRRRLIAENEDRSGITAIEVRWKRQDKSPVWVRNDFRAIRGASGAIEHFDGFVHDIQKRKEAEEAMRRSEERFRRLFDSNTIGIVIADLAGSTLEANDAYLDMMGYGRDELLAGKLSWDELTPPEYRKRDQEAVDQLRRTGVAQPWEKEMLRKDGKRVPVLIGLAMLPASEGTCIAYIVDLSSRKILEEQLRLSQKMEAVGQLAGGVAHDFNNLLTAILGYGNLLASRLAPDAPGREEIDEILRASERAAALTKQLLAFSRKQVLAPVVLDVNELVRNLEKLLRRLIEEDVELVTRLDPSVASVRADPGQLEQVIMNLAVNARDAMPHGGKLTIETANTFLDEAYAQQHVTVHPGRYVMVAVSDTGIGMDAATKQHIFEPFFTTKEKGKGTGLGLSTVYGIVKQSGGNIWVYSEPGKGTTFKVYLPRVEETAAESVPPSVNSLPGVGTETILLVEDEASIRALSRRVLEQRGYRVLEASSGKDALEQVRVEEGPIHLLLTDLVMPDMGGTELAARLEELHPGMRVLFMSGYTDDGVVRSGLLGPGRAFLQKPFTPHALARKVREVLS